MEIALILPSNYSVNISLKFPVQNLDHEPFHKTYKVSCNFFQSTKGSTSSNMHEHKSSGKNL